MPSRIPTAKGPAARVAATHPSHRPGPSPVARQYENAPDRKADRAFYKSRPWRLVRAVVLSRNPLCADCLRRGRYTIADQVHHVIDRKAAPELALALDNLESLCLPCHNGRRREPEGPAPSPR